MEGGGVRGWMAGAERVEWVAGLGGEEGGAGGRRGRRRCRAEGVGGTWRGERVRAIMFFFNGCKI